MDKSAIMNPQLRIRALGVAIFLVGLSLRLYHLDRFPERNRTADEYAWTWSGMTLLAEGVPRAWSWLPGYAGFPVQTWRGNQYRIVKPWLDHPPLYPIYVGAFVHATGTHDIFAVELGVMRASTMVLWAAAFFLFWAVARRYAEPPLVLLALAFWATAPPSVWNGRLVMAEQLMLPLALAGWLALLKYAETRRRGWLVAVAVVAALLPLCKAAALAFALFLFTVAVLRRERALALAVCVGGAAGLALYAGYGAYFGWPLFRTILRVQAARFTNFGGFYALIFAPRVVEKPFMYLPFLLGFFTLLADLRDRRYVDVGLFAAVYAGCIAFFLPWNEYGWYLIPLYPALAFGLASFAVRAWQDARAEAGWPWLLFSGTYLCWIACDAQLGVPAVWRWLYLGSLVALPLVAVLGARAPSRWRLGFAVLVAAQLGADTWYTLRR
jgi:Dolichyl-phosphate-mannose-protein mannosyltransferase